jgi:16S rRNA (cytosine1402-N4)-methyltransferase
MTTQHIAVMTEEVIRALQPHDGGAYLDATLGGGTHTEELLKRSSPFGRVLSLDVDTHALERARTRLASYGARWTGVESNFRRLQEVAQENGFAPCDGILLDLGLSSDELADPKKGLSFLQDGPLDMRLGPMANEDGLTAADIVNSWTGQEIERVLRVFGEESNARIIARAIVTARHHARIIGTLDLVAVITSVVPRRSNVIHPATKTFQALRIAVNDELENLKRALIGAQTVLKPGGRIAVITFHSLEDRIVKQAFRGHGWSLVHTKPLVPTDAEIQHNPRSRSAKLRTAERT